MTIPTTGIILGSTRQNRFGEQPTNWIGDLIAQRGDTAAEVIDLRDYPMPLFDAPVPPNYAPVDDEHARAFVQKISELDGPLFITAEYNHSITAALKNALDHLPLTATSRKPAAFLGYGGTGGARAIEQLRLIAVELALVPTRAAVHIGREPYLGVLREGKSFNDFPDLVTGAGAMLDELAWYARTLKSGRDLGADAALAA